MYFYFKIRNVTTKVLRDNFVDETLFSASKLFQNIFLLEKFQTEQRKYLC